jgi:hypothetical protein
MPDGGTARRTFESAAQHCAGSGNLRNNVSESRHVSVPSGLLQPAHRARRSGRPADISQTDSPSAPLDMQDTLSEGVREGRVVALRGRTSGFRGRSSLGKLHLAHHLADPHCGGHISPVGSRRRADPPPSTWCDSGQIDPHLPRPPQRRRLIPGPGIEIVLIQTS